MEKEIKIYTLNEFPLGSIEEGKIIYEPGVKILTGIWKGCIELVINDLSFGVLLQIDSVWHKGYFLSIKTIDEVRVKLLCMEIRFRE